MHRLLIVLALLLLAPLAFAQVYKWTDANGTVHYSEAPPASGTNYKQVTTTGTVEPRGAPPSDEASEARPASEQNQMEEEPAEPMADTPENRVKFCQTLSSNLDALRGKGPVVTQQADGELAAMNDDQRQQQIDAAQSQYEQFCQGNE